MAITPSQLAARKSSIGSSDAAAILAPSKWADEHKIRALKLGLLDPDDAGPKALVGTLMEPVMIKLLELDLEKKIVPGTETFAHPKYPFLTANLDAFVERQARGVELGEFKVSGIAAGWGDDGSDEIPLAVTIQVQHQMAVTDAPGVHVMRMFPDGRDWSPHRYYVPRDESIIDGLVSYLREWHDRHIVHREEIPLRDRPPVYAIQTAIRRDESSCVEVAPDLFAAVYRASEARKAAEKSEELAKSRLLAAMGDSGGAKCGLGTFFLKTESAGLKVPVDLLKERFPKVYEELAAPTTRKMPRMKLSDAGKAELQVNP